MRILTVRQPYAWAIMHGGKDVENRPRNIAGGYRGLVAIHAGLRFAEDRDAAKRICDRLVPESEWDRPLYCGAIIGVVDLIDVHKAYDAHHGCWTAYEPRGGGDAVEALCSPWAEFAAYHLVLANPRPLAEPIPYRGALGLRRLDPWTAHGIQCQLGPVCDHSERCCTEHGTHSMPHQGCILR